MNIEATLNKTIAQETTAGLEMEFSEAELLGEPTWKTVEPQIFPVMVNEPSLLIYTKDSKYGESQCHISQRYCIINLQDYQ